jgi:hypothetical protein
MHLSIIFKSYGHFVNSKYKGIVYCLLKIFNITLGFKTDLMR